MNNMKKVFISLVLFFAPLNVFAFDDCTITLKENDSYMMFMDEKPTQIYVTAPKILKAQSAADLYNQNFQLVFRALSKGTTDVLITTVKGKQYTIKVKVEENPVISNEVFEIDLPPDLLLK